jgi:hypothetical protein
LVFAAGIHDQGRSRRYLGLKDQQFDVVIGPYDFLMLCTVAEKTLKLDFDEQFRSAQSGLRSSPCPIVMKPALHCRNCLTKIGIAARVV